MKSSSNLLWYAFSDDVFWHQLTNYNQLQGGWKLNITYSNYLHYNDGLQIPNLQRNMTISLFSNIAALSREHTLVRSKNLFNSLSEVPK